MKVTLFTLSIILLFSSCTKSKEDKAKDSIEKYVSQNFHDPESYEPISFGKLDSSYTSPFHDEAYVKLEQENDELTARLDVLFRKGEKSEDIDELTTLVKDEKFLASQIDNNEAKKIEVIANFTGSFNGYIMEHELRAKNAEGALNKKTYRFEFDTNMVVVRAEELKSE